MTPLHYAAFLGNKKIAGDLIKKGAKINAVDNYKNTPLHYAELSRNQELISLLKSKGADEKAKNDIPGVSSGVVAKFENTPEQMPKAFTTLDKLEAAIWSTDDEALLNALIERRSIDINTEFADAKIFPLQLALLEQRKNAIKFLRARRLIILE